MGVYSAVGMIPKKKPGKIHFFPGKIPNDTSLCSVDFSPLHWSTCSPKLAPIQIV